MYVVDAIALGVSSGLTETATSAVKDAYSAVKQLLAAARYSELDLKPITRRPESKAKRASLREDLESLGAADDNDLLEAAWRFLAEVKKYDPTAGRPIGIDLEGFDARSVKIGKVTSTGHGVRVKDASLKGDLHVAEVHAGYREHQHP